MAVHDIILAAANASAGGGGGGANPNAYDFYNYGAITNRSGSTWDVVKIGVASDARYDGGSLRSLAQSQLGGLYWNQNYGPVMFSSDGTKFLALQRNGYLISGTLSSAWDLNSTYTFNGYNLSGLTSNLNANYIAGFWTTDGENCYAMDNGSIVHFTLATAWDAGSTLTIVNDKSNSTLISQNSGANTGWNSALNGGFTFANNGSVLYVVVSNALYAYNLISGGTAYDLDDYKYEGDSTGKKTYSWNNTANVMSNGDGTKLIIATSYSSALTNGGVWSLELSTAGDLSSESNFTASAYAKYWLGTYASTSNSQGGYGFTCFRGTSGTSAATGSNFIANTIDTGNNRMQEYVMCAYGYDYINEGTTTTPGNHDGHKNGFAFKRDGTKLFRTGYVRLITRSSLSTAWEINTASFDSGQYFDTTSQSTNPAGVEFNDDGTKMYVTDQSGTIYQYSLSTAYDLTTVSYDNVSLSVTAVSTLGTRFRWGDSGTKMFIASYSTDKVRVYNLSTAYDLSTASLDSSNSLIANTTAGQPKSFVMSSDGTYGYLLDRIGYGFEQWSFSTAWDLTSGTFEGQKTFEDASTSSYSDWSIGAYFNQLWNDIDIDATGERLYVSDYYTSKIFQITIDGS